MAPVFRRYMTQILLMPAAAYQSNMKTKRARASSAKHRDALNLYNKLTELVSALSELVDIQELTDTIILQVCTWG